ncbi:MAG: hypothetical protein IJB87_00745 [Alistipes sp.]|nr:hypothetical protein [Alistipes sp.]
MGLTACEKSADDSGIVNTQEGYADLTISLNTPSLQVSTRTLASDPKNQGGSWTTWEKFVDGALLYHVTIFVVKEDGTLVAYRDFHSGSDDIKPEDAAEGGNGFYETSAVNTSASTGTAVKATFTSAAQMHGDIERLTPGDYKVIAVANYAPIDLDGNSYAGLGAVAEDGNAPNGISSGSDNNFTNIVNSIIGSFNKNSGLSDFTQTGANGSAFFTYKLNSGTDRVCKQLPQPLVMIRNVTLSSGKNQLTGLLSRTFARIRLDVLNNSSNTFLDISDLSFQAAYASQNAYLFNDVAAGTANLYSHFDLYDNNDNVSLNTKGDLVVTSADAIVSASPSQRLVPGAKSPILDCYILEGKIAEDAAFAYSFTATYQATMADGDATHNYTIHSFYNNSSGAQYGLLDFYLFIRSDMSNGSNLYKIDTESNKMVISGTSVGDESSSFSLEPEFIWEIVLPGGEDSVDEINNDSQALTAEGYLKSVSTNLYLQPYTGGTDYSLKMGTNPGDLIFRINFNGEDELGTIFCKYGDEYYYIATGTAEWTKLGTDITALDTTSSSGNSSNRPGGGNNRGSYGFQQITFETIVATPVDPTTETVTQHIKISVENAGSTQEEIKREIVRNDFFYGTIPITTAN